MAQPHQLLQPADLASRIKQAAQKSRQLLEENPPPPEPVNLPAPVPVLTGK